MNRNELPDTPVGELWDELTYDEQNILKFLKENGIPNNPDYAEYVKNREKEIDDIENPILRKSEIEQFDIRKAYLIGLAGDLDYAEELLSGIGRMAQETNNLDLEDAADRALSSLGL